VIALLLAACLLSASPDAVVSCPGWHTRPARVRDRHGKLVRSRSAVREFQRRTGYPHGRPGYVVDHRQPLGDPCRGVDAPWNMQWQTIAEAKAKDLRRLTERQTCRVNSAVQPDPR
jgi:hypothetical protein